tara:strand:- start:539 stop:820 length:282 start_codon:yes stop_codon:yes gene_type:complete
MEHIEGKDLTTEFLVDVLTTYYDDDQQNDVVFSTDREGLIKYNIERKMFISKVTKVTKEQFRETVTETITAKLSKFPKGKYIISKAGYELAEQ